MLNVARTINRSETSAPINLDDEAEAIQNFLHYILEQEPRAKITIEYPTRSVTFTSMML